MKNLALLFAIVFTAISTVFGNIQEVSALNWDWSYSSPGIEASGNLTTNDIPDDLGFYLITGITGTRNDETIIGLEATGTVTPGNEPYKVDNLISSNPKKLTIHGFGYFTSEGNFVNMFFNNFLQPARYYEVFSAPPLTSGHENFGPEDSELPVSFSATPMVKGKLKTSKSTANLS